MKFKYLLITLLLLATTITYAQQRSIAEADEYFNAAEYPKAKKIYSEVYNDKPTTALLYKIAECERLQKNYVLAEKSYTELLRTEDYPAEAIYNMALILMHNNKYPEAITKLNDYANLAPTDIRTAKTKEACNWAIKNAQKKSEYGVNAMEDITINGLCFGLAMYKDGLVYARPKKANVDVNIKQYELVYTDLLNKKNATVQFDKNIQSSLFIGAPTFSGDGKTFYFSKNAANKKAVRPTSFGKNGISSDGKNTLAIYSTKYSDKKWEEPQAIALNNFEYSCTHPTVSLNNKVMYFASNMPGGYGGYDIYKSEYITGKWLKPVNLGTKVNTAGNEMFPFLHNDTALYFSSTGLVGLGGADVFKISIANINTQNPTHLGAGVNSVNDDFGLILNRDGSEGYMATNRYSNDNTDLILSLKKTYAMKEINTVIIDEETGKPIVDTDVLVYMGDSLIAFETSDRNGLINLSLDGRFKYHIVVQNKAYDTFEKDFDARTEDPSKFKVNLKNSFIEGQLLDQLTQKPIAGAEVEIYDGDKLVGFETTDKNGKFKFKGDKKKKYRIVARKDGYEVAETIFDPSKQKGMSLRAMKLNLNMTPIAKKNAVFTFDDILFDLGKANLQQASYAILDRLAEYMVSKPTVKIELSAHTDMRGNPASNQTLSDRRAASCVIYLTQKGVINANLKPKGYGATRPKVKCATAAACTEEQHFINRRVEIKILDI